MSEGNILSKVIEVEGQIQEKLREEKVRSLEWLERARKETERQLAAEEETLKEYCRRTVDDTGAAAEKEAEVLLRDSALETERLAGISDHVLSRMVLKYIRDIVPQDLSVPAGPRKVGRPSS